MSLIQVKTRQVDLPKQQQPTKRRANKQQAISQNVSKVMAKKKKKNRTETLVIFCRKFAIASTTTGSYRLK